MCASVPHVASFPDRFQTKELATRYERGLQESESVMEKSKARFDLTAEELERVLVAKEGENMRDTSMRSPGAGGGGGKRALGKAVQKGGLLLKGKNPQNVWLLTFVIVAITYTPFFRFNAKKMM